MLKQMGIDATPLIILLVPSKETRDKAKELTKKRQEIFTCQTWTCNGWYWKRL